MMGQIYQFYSSMNPVLNILKVLYLTRLSENKQKK